jgi:hypothetical protein
VPGVAAEIVSAQEGRISRADALVAVAEGYLAAEADAGSGVLPVELIVHVDEATLRTPVDPAKTAAEANGRRRHARGRGGPLSSNHRAPGL